MTIPDLKGGSIRKAACVTAALLICAGSLSAFTFGGASGETEPETVYKETPVSRGDLTVGVSETGSATIKAVSISEDVSVQVNEILVKAGQSVREGDPLVKLSLEDLQDQLDALALDYEKALVALEQAKIDQTLNTLNAQSTLNQSKSKGDVADQAYELALDQAEYEYVNAKSSLSELGSTLNDYENELDDMSDTLSSYGKTADEARAALIAEIRAQCADMEGFAEKTDDEVLSYYEGLDSESKAPFKSLYDRWDKAEEKYDAYNSNYDSKEEDLESKIASTKRSIKSQSLTVKQNETNQELEKISAESEKNESVTTSENAQTIYDATLAQINNNLKSAELSVKETQKEIDTLKKSMVDGTITAPCDGLVMSIGCEAGGTVNEGEAIITIADSANAYAVVTIDQEDIADVKIGSAANVKFSAYDEITYTGTIDSISITPARSGSSTVSYTVSIKLDGDTSALYEGMTCDITFITKAVKNVLYLSNKAVTSDQTTGKETVKVKRADGTIETVEVTTGFSDGRNVEIQSGLSEGDVALIESQVNK